MKTIKVQKMLRDIGLQLDRNQYPRICNGGVIKPGTSAIASSVPGEVIDYVFERARATSTSEQGAQTPQGSPHGPGAYNCSPPVVSASFLCEHYQAELNAVEQAYPGASSWQQDDGLWLLTESTVLPGLGKRAAFLTAIPYSPPFLPRSWGFWKTSISHEWIGPRHTNFPDGSICAFNPFDGTWRLGDEIIKLLDLYTLWACRHEHLQIFGRWPGLQSVPYVYERVTELNDDEYCGCGRSQALYRDCCKPRDMSRSKIESFVRFYNFAHGQLNRLPPAVVCKFVNTRKEPPQIKDIFENR